MAHKIQIKRGNKADLPTLDAGEFGLCQDTNELFIGNNGNQKIFPPTEITISDVEGLQTALDGKVDDSQVLTNVPANAKFTDTVYTHPATHSADMIVDGTTNKAYTATEKNKLAGIADNANNYTHPTTAGNKHIPSGGSNGKILGYDSDGAAKWIDPPAGVEIANNLTTTVAGKALDATQGKVLAEQIRDISVEADTIPLSPETAALYGLTGEDATVDGAFSTMPFTGSYLAFCGNVNADMLDAAFGKGNEDGIVGLGRQLAMYAWFKGEDKIVHPYPILQAKYTLESVWEALPEILQSDNLISLIKSSPYAYGSARQEGLPPLFFFDSVNAQNDLGTMTTQIDYSNGSHISVNASNELVMFVRGWDQAKDMLYSATASFNAFSINPKLFNSLVIQGVISGPNYSSATKIDVTFGGVTQTFNITSGGIKELIIPLTALETFSNLSIMLQVKNQTKNVGGSCTFTMTDVSLQLL